MSLIVDCFFFLFFSEGGPAGMTPTPLESQGRERDEDLSLVGPPLRGQPPMTLARQGPLSLFIRWENSGVYIYIYIRVVG